MYWLASQFDFQTLDEIERGFTDLRPEIARVTVNGADYAIPDCCYEEFWFGDSSPWSLPPAEGEEVDCDDSYTQTTRRGRGGRRGH
jgi:hypothetical protein